MKPGKFHLAKQRPQRSAKWEESEGGWAEGGGGAEYMKKDK